MVSKLQSIREPAKKEHGKPGGIIPGHVVNRNYTPLLSMDTRSDYFGFCGRVFPGRPSIRNQNRGREAALPNL